MFIFIGGFSAKVTCAFLVYKNNDGMFHIFDQIKGFKETGAKRALPSLHRWSLEITLTVPLGDPSADPRFLKTKRERGVKNTLK